MFHSPSIRLYTSENTESSLQRKPGNLSTRKPFLDRSVNSKTPDAGKLQKPKLNFTKDTKTEKSTLSPKLNNDLNAEDFTYSFKDVKDSYEDIWPKSRLCAYKVLHNYCSVKDTPPPSPEPALVKIDPIFFELPNFEMSEFKLHEETLIDIIDSDLPYFDDTELNESM